MTFTASGLSTNIGMDGMLVRVHELMQDHHQLLRASHREAGNDDFSAAPGRAIHHIRQRCGNVRDGLVKPVSVGALHDQVVDRVGRDRIAEDRQMLAAYVAGEGQAHAVGFDDHGGRAEHVAGFVGPVAESGSDFLGCA